MTMFILNRVLLNTLIVVIFSFCATSQIPYDARISEKDRITSYNVCYTKLLRDFFEGFGELLPVDFSMANS